MVRGQWDMLAVAEEREQIWNSGPGQSWETRERVERTRVKKVKDWTHRLM